jgi:hypothetical protein
VAGFGLLGFGLFISSLVSLNLAIFARPNLALAADEAFQIPPLTRRDLLALAREPLTAALTNREPRVPKPNPALATALPMVVSLYLNGQLAARAWVLENPGPLGETATRLGAQILVDPQLGRILSPEELARATFGVAILRDLKPARDDRDLGPNQAAIVFNGLKQAVGLPSDAPPPKKARDLLSLTCQLAGLRPGAWLTSQTTIITGQVAETLE